VLPELLLPVLPDVWLALLLPPETSPPAIVTGTFPFTAF
jgi:hypothetical protein